MTHVSDVLERLEASYGPQQPDWPVEPYQFLVWWHCGYPASDERCAKGWELLRRTIGIELRDLLDAPIKQLAAALKPGGMVPELRAMRLKQIAQRIETECSGDLRGALFGPISETRRLLKKFPNIADPGADRILLFAGIAPIAAIPSNCPHVLVRILKGRERENYGVNYRTAQQAIEAEIPESTAARTRAYLLLKRHGQETCKRSKPRCGACPVNTCCAYFAA